MRAWVKAFNQRAGKGGRNHKCQGSARKLRDKLNVRNKEGKESGTTRRLRAWGVDVLEQGDWGWQRISGGEERGEGALSPESELPPRRQTGRLKQGPAGRCEGCPQRGDSGLWKRKSFFNLD